LREPDLNDLIKLRELGLDLLMDASFRNLAEEVLVEVDKELFRTLRHHIQSNTCRNCTPWGSMLRGEFLAAVLGSPDASLAPTDWNLPADFLLFPGHESSTALIRCMRSCTSFLVLWNLRLRNRGFTTRSRVSSLVSVGHIYREHPVFVRRLLVAIAADEFFKILFISIRNDEVV